MKHKDYWQKRFKLLEEAQNRKGQECCAEIERQYRRAQREIEGKIAAWYQRFAANNKISLQEARRMLRAKELAELKWDVDEYIRHGKENAVSQQWVGQLENASARYHISRLEAIKLQLQQSLEVMFGNQLDSIDSAMRDVYMDGYYHTAFEIQKGLGTGWNFMALDEKAISKVIKKPWAPDGKDFSERIWGSRTKLVNELSKTLTQNIILGQDPQKAIDAIAKKMKVSKSNAGRLVMTEEAYFSSAAQKDCFAELGVEQYEIVATLDSHTSELCRGMDGKRFTMQQFEPGVTAPPFHVYCRTTTAPYFEDDFEQPGERAARDEETGEIYYVPADMTYQQWKSAFVNGDKAGLQRAKADDIMKLPRYEEAVIPEAKFLQYALNPEKDANKAKAFKAALGYDMSNYKDLIANIRENLPNCKAIPKNNSNYGMKYEVAMYLDGPNGKCAKVLTGWIDDIQTGEIRLTSVYVDKE